MRWSPELSFLALPPLRVGFSILLLVSKICLRHISVRLTRGNGESLRSEAYIETVLREAGFRVPRL
jgi:hypothetical protein